MNPRYAAIAILGVLLHFRTPLSAAAVIGVLVVAACAILAVLTVRALHKFTSCPHLRTATP